MSAACRRPGGNTIIRTHSRVRMQTNLASSPPLKLYEFQGFLCLVPFPPARPYCLHLLRFSVNITYQKEGNSIKFINSIEFIGQVWYHIYAKQI